MTADGRPMTAVHGQILCRSEHEYAQRPIAFHWGSKYFEVAEIIAGWRHPDGKRFCVRANTDQLFELRYDEVNHEWTILQL
ncbi:MAG: hypothetical protein FJ010_03180 [Chloroflexi bacterium]|nr:hypothetical protein [Chloroflexota bacterium]